MAVKAPKPPTNGNGKVPTMEISAPAAVERLGLGRTGLRQWSGRIDEEFLKELKNERKYQVYKEMSENDPIVGATLRCIEFLIRGVDWRIDPDDQTDTAQVEMADHISERLFHGMHRSWPEVLVEILSFLPFGWSFHEIIYEARPDGIWWGDWPVRAQESLFRWIFQKDALGKDTDEVIAMVQQVPTDATQRTVPLEKGLLFRLGAHKNNPEGISIIRNAYLPWYYKNHLQRIEAIGIERDLAGYPVLYVPGEVLDNASSQAYLAAQKIVTNIKRDEQEGALLSSARDGANNLLWELKLLSTGGQRAFNTNDIINRYDTRIAQTCLADFIVLGQQGRTGSFALADSKTEIFSLALKAILDTIVGTINRYAIPRLAELNGWPTDALPKLVHGDIELPDLAAIGAFITALSGAGVPLFPDMKLENRLREIGGLPTLSPDEFDQREAVVQADKQMQMEAQLAAAKATAQGADQKATDAKAQSDQTAQAVKQFLERPVEKAAPQPIALTFNGAPMTFSTPAPGAQTFNLAMPPVTQPITNVIHAAPAPPPADVIVNVEAAKAADVSVPITNVIEATAPMVMPAPVVENVIHTGSTTVEPAKIDIHIAQPDAPPPSQVTVTNVIEKQDAPTVVMDMQPVADAIGAAAEKLKRPSKLTITNPDGTVTEATPTDEQT